MLKHIPPEISKTIPNLSQNQKLSRNLSPWESPLGKYIAYYAGGNTFPEIVKFTPACTVSQYSAQYAKSIIIQMGPVKWTILKAELSGINFVIIQAI